MIGDYHSLPLIEHIAKQNPLNTVPSRAKITKIIGKVSKGNEQY
jgi:hypothetical protein